MELSPLAVQLKKRWAELDSARGKWLPQWQRAAVYVMPYRESGINGTVAALPTEQSRVWDRHAVVANEILASGSMANMSPLDEVWFKAEPMGGAEDEKTAFAEMSEEARGALAVSNFYVEAFEATLDISGLGIGAVYGDYLAGDGLVFQHWPVGTFACAEDAWGRIDTVFREFKLTARQAAQKFGEQALSPKLAKAFAEQKEDEVDFLHCIYPRLKNEVDLEAAMAGNQAKMPIACVYMEKEGHIYQEIGYMEMPVAVCRFRTWQSAAAGVYGLAPIFTVLEEAKEASDVRRNLKRILHRKADPPILVPASMEGEIEYNPGGITYFSNLQENVLPKAWLHEGDVRGEWENLAECHKAIDAAFHVDMIQMFSRIDKDLKIPEIAELQTEKMVNFSPTFIKRMNEFYDPLIRRVFSLLMANGHFAKWSNLRGAKFKIKYLSKMAMALQFAGLRASYKALQRRANNRSMQVEDADDLYDWDKLERSVALGEGLDPAFLRSEAAIEERREQRQSERQQVMQMEQALGGAEVAAKMKGVIPS